VLARFNIKLKVPYDALSLQMPWRRTGRVSGIERFQGLSVTSAATEATSVMPGSI